MTPRRFPLWTALGVVLVVALIVGSGVLSSSPPTAAQRSKADLKAKREAFAAYDWFVAYLLCACEEMLFFAKTDKIWLRNLQPNLSYHNPSICSQLNTV